MKMVRDYSIQGGKGLVKLKNAATRYNVKCAHKSPSWRLHASTLPDGRIFQKTYNG